MELKRGEGKQRFWKGGKLGQGVGTLKGGLEPPYELWSCLVATLWKYMKVSDTICKYIKCQYCLIQTLTKSV